MLTRLVVEDFQSIGRADIELGGLTVLVGPSNRGKSAIVRALEALSFNPPLSRGEQSYIRRGRKECVVVVEDDESTTIGWVKGPTPLYYTKTDEGEEEYTKLGKDVPDEVRALLGVRDIAIDDQFEIRPQFHEQGIDYGWLLRESASRRARVLAAMTKLDVVVGAQGLARRDVRQTGEAIKTATTLIEEIDVELEAHEDLPAQWEHFREAETLHAELESDQQRLERARDLLARRDAWLEQSRPLPKKATKATVDALRADHQRLQQAVTLVNRRNELELQAEQHNNAATDARATARGARTELAALRAKIDVCEVCGRGRSKSCCQ